MSCAAKEQCLIQDRTLQAPDGHLCRGVCGGHLHRLVEDPSDDELDDGETVERTGEGVVSGGSMSQPSYAELSPFFYPLEHFA